MRARIVRVLGLVVFFFTWGLSALGAFNGWWKISNRNVFLCFLTVVIFVAFASAVADVRFQLRKKPPQEEAQQIFKPFWGARRRRSC